MNPGDKLGEYEIVAPLKRGGMATLYLGCRTGAGGFAKHVAIKVVHPHLAGDRKFVEMFLDEARLSARIDHPNVVHVYELGEGDEDTYYLVMEYVHGCSLSQLLAALAKAERKLSPELAAFIGMRVAAGLHSAHEVTGPDGEPLAAVHRDISPQNILLAYKGYVKLIDFGIAKMRGRVHQTTTGSLKGKFRYMAPEQAAGRPVDRRTDVYALGIVLWEMLTMRRLFDATDELQLIEQIRKPKVPAPSTLASNVPDGLERAVMHALAPDPAERPQSAYELQRELGEGLPSALAMDAPDLARLLHATMGDAIRADAERLPGSLSKVISAEQNRAEEPSGQVMEALTVATPGLAEGGFHDVTVESDETETSEPATSEAASPSPSPAEAGPAAPRDAPVREAAPAEAQVASAQAAGADKSTVRLGSFASSASAGPAPARGSG
ncbi:MAG: protein kinase domain-containing protein, partial [Myxococcota bacterium]